MTESIQHLIDLSTHIHTGLETNDNKFYTKRACSSFEKIFIRQYFWKSE